MKILINHHGLNKLSKNRGVGVYADNLQKALQVQYPNDKFIATADQSGMHDADLVHYPYFDPFALSSNQSATIPTITTIHDLTPIVMSHAFPKGLRGTIKWQFQKLRAQKLSHIITDSECSKNDIIRELNIEASRVSVVYLGPSIPRILHSTKDWQAIKDKYSLSAKYLLYVGDINWNKNIPGLISEYLSLKDPKVHLLLVGKVFGDRPAIPEWENIAKLLNTAKASQKIHLLGYVSKNELSALYQHASFYIQPSFYEGFGLNILDAMTNGCPVLSSSKGSLPEIGGHAIEYFDPYNKGELASKITTMLADHKKLKELQALGTTQSAKFSWEKCARETYAIYQKTIQTSN